MDPQLAATFRDTFEKLSEQIRSAVFGQDDAVQTVMLALACGGHVLLEGPSGVGKTMIVKTLANAVSLQYRRIQFTPDLTPADIIGTYVVLESHGRRKFEFQQGPLFANIVLADEINRATPKTQSALLEAMEDGCVSVANESYDLPDPFFVAATRGETDGEGVFPLPASQLDRFHFHIRLETPPAEQLRRIIECSCREDEPAAGARVDRESLLTMRQAVRSTAVDAEAASFAARIIEAAQPESGSAPELCRRYLQNGVSPRAGAAMVLGARALAILDGRDQPTADDIRRVAPLVLRHRLLLNFDGHADAVDSGDIVAAVVDSA